MFGLKGITGVLLTLGAVLLISGATLAAPDTNTLATQINKDLRQAERLMHGGKKMEADTLLKQVNLMLEELRSTDAAHNKLNSLDSKYTRTRKSLDKRLGKSSSASPVAKTAPPQAIEPVPTKSPSASSSQRSGGYKQQMMEKSIKKAVKDVDYEIGRAREMLTPDNPNSKFNDTPAEKSQKANGYLEKAENHLAKVEKKYSTMPPEASNKFKESRTKIAEVQAEITLWQSAEEDKGIAAAKTSAAAAADKEKSLGSMEQDARQMVKLHDQYYTHFEKIHGGSLVHGMKIDEARQALALIEEAEKTIPLFSTELGQLADRYGTNSMDIYNTFHKAGYQLNNSEEHKMVQMIEAVDNTAKSRNASANTLAGHAATLLGAFSSQLNDARLERMGEAKELLLVGQQIDPQNAQIQQMLTQIDEQIIQVADKMTAQIDAATWAGNVSSFSGPGTVKNLVSEAKKYFENDRDWGKKPGRQLQILDVCVTGPWKVAEKDIFGRVTRWRLPIHLAITDERLKPRNIASVYDSSIVAMEGASDNAPRTPPFDGFWVGDSWMMRLDKF